MANKITDKQKGKILMVIGIITVLFLLSLQTPKIMYDGEQNNFSLRIIDWNNKAESGDVMNINLRVMNDGDNDGSMYVQCSILDRNENNWLQGLQSALLLEENRNCVLNEPFTQTARISLGSGDRESVSFTVAIPDNPESDSVIFCDAFEQCWREGGDSYSSDKEVIQIDIVPNDDNPDNNNLVSRAGDTCEKTTDCSGWLIGKAICIEGLCVDNEDVKETTIDDDSKVKLPDFSDDNISEWAGRHKSILFIAGFIILIIGVLLTFSEPKKNSFRGGF